MKVREEDVESGPRDGGDLAFAPPLSVGVVFERANVPPLCTLVGVEVLAPRAAGAAVAVGTVLVRLVTGVAELAAGVLDGTTIRGLGVERLLAELSRSRLPVNESLVAERAKI